ncbi:MAG TPA: hypothetical protein H9888_03110 [Candidatus Rikenella faecigallinarum]|uniref:Fibrobacter succinogenes major paralogous domain-containing protein n=1 Tax=Candidatus Rikenella faecigallinarum TaxID=2838745 RepID=A0A9D1QDY9_9BACT|nr:hypothetical protein [Candidatus Rikenella faecigallinarum]
MVDEDNTTLVYIIKNPLAFIYNSASPYDWYTNNSIYQNNALWGDAKSEYNPCPKGWKIPQNGTWNDFSNITMSAIGFGTNVANGRIYNKTAWYPMEGYLHHQSGQLTYVGYNGYCWLSAIETIYARYLSFTLSSINPSYPTNRARGFSIRCIQE